eukprot:TRINITY_DN96506_c0_g1_i1.p1 TRINITY_DN96506_c0_g1~~TRINITY_DN96506_c0_g1_i1.p1  ORF type:complete len:915 (-),score=162.03 TRINITY_DN96506_c0_g1_i1:13-2502(-)
MDKTPPAGTGSAAAMDVLDSQFQSASTKRLEMVVMKCKTHCEKLSDNTVAKVFAEQIKDRVLRFGQDNPHSNVEFQSYFDFTGHHQILNPFESKDQQSILLMWTWSVPVNLKQKAEAFVVNLKGFISSMGEFEGAGAMEVKLTGNVILDHEMMVSIFEFALHEVKTVWLPILILGYVLRSARLLLLALTPMLFEILVAFGFMYFVSLKMTISYYALMMMLMLIMALSWDYALFMLTRYKTEREAGADVEQAVVKMVASSGSIVVVSGVVLSICWSVMLGLPDMFKTFGIAASSAIMVCVFAQLTFVAPVLAILPWLGPEKGTPDEDQHDTGGVLASARQFQSGPYYCMGRFLTAFPCNLISFVVVYVLMMPLTLRFLQNFDVGKFAFREMGHSFEMTMPRGSQAFNTSLQIVKDFDFEMTLMPVLIFATNTVATAPESAGSVAAPLVNEDLFKLNCEMIKSLIGTTEGKAYELRAKSFQSPSVPIDKSYASSSIPFSKDLFKEVFGSLMCPSLSQLNLVRKNFFSKNVFLTQTSDHLDLMWEEMVRKNAMLTVVNPAIDPLGPQAFELEAHVSKILRDMEQRGQFRIPGLRYYMFSPASVVTDLITVTSSALPMCFLICVLICFTLIALWFCAFLVPFKLFVTVIVPITWTYGAAFFVYEDGVLESLGFPGLSPTGKDGLDWTVPVFSLTFLIGLALDYDFFLFERVFEFRTQGFGDRESIQLGLSATGGTISAAGLILGLTFLALVFTSELPMMNQQGFVFVFSIVVDTFIVRTLAVPALLSMSPWLNYWPRTMPTPRFEWLGEAHDARANLRVASMASTATSVDSDS